MTIPAELLELLRCPRCRGQLRMVHRSEAALECAPCQLRYAIRDGIPIMLIDQAEPL